MILKQHGLPTPEFAVLDNPDVEIPELPYPVIVKPKNEAVSFGLKVCNDEAELREGAAVIFKEFGQAVLAEQFIKGREVNVGILGNSPPEAFPPVQLDFGKGGPAIYTYEDKTGRSGRQISHICPAPLGPELTERSKEIAVKAFKALGLYDCARVDMRLDDDGNLYILEINSLPSLGEHGSYLVGADAVGLDFAKFVNRLVEVASARYFGTPAPPTLETKKKDPAVSVFGYVTERRDRLEKRLQEWVSISARTNDPMGVNQIVDRVGRVLTELDMKPVKDLTDPPEVATWETRAGLDDGVLLVAHADVPIDTDFAPPAFRRDPEWLYGDGIGSRAALVSLEFALRSLRNIRKLRRLPLGVLLYTDEGQDARHSAETIKEAAGRAKQVLVLRPGGLGNEAIVQRRGHRTYRLTVEGEPLRIGRATRKVDAMRWTWSKLEECAKLTSTKERVAVSTIDIDAKHHPMRAPHRVTTTMIVTFPDDAVADAIEERIRGVLGKRGLKWRLDLVSHRPAMRERRGGLRLARSLEAVAERWEIPLKHSSSAWPSVAGLAPAKAGTLCGVGPVATDLRTPDEAVQRISFIQRTLLLAQYLAEQVPKK